MRTIRGPIQHKNQITIKYIHKINNIFNYYNKLIFTKRSKEMLMRKDHLYDIVVFVKYNSTRVKKNKGSAIFINVARKNYSPTKGCVALNVKNLKNLLNKINLKTKIKITF